MKHIFKIIAMLVAISAVWVALLETSTVPRSYTWLLPIYLVVALGCYGLFMVGFGLMFFPTCPQEAILLQQDIVEAKEFLAKKGVDVGSEGCLLCYFLDFPSLVVYQSSSVIYHLMVVLGLASSFDGSIPVLHTEVSVTIPGRSSVEIAEPILTKALVGRWTGA